MTTFLASFFTEELEELESTEGDGFSVDGNSVTVTQVETDVLARVRLYETQADAASDMDRGLYEDPDDDIGLICDVVGDGVTVLDPDGEGILPTNQIAITVTNLSGESASITWAVGGDVITVAVEEVITREPALPPDDVSAYVISADGTEIRIGVDEQRFVLTDLSYGSTLPGGYETADVSFVVRPGFHHGGVPGTRGANVIPQIERHANIELRLGDRTKVWEGRLDGTPERSEEGVVTLSAMGDQARLEDMPNITFLGVDPSLDGWEEPPRKRRKEEADNNRTLNKAYTVSSDEDGMTITMEQDRAIKVAQRGEVWYRAGAGARLGHVQYLASEVAPTDMDPEVLAFGEPDDTEIDSQNLVTGLTLTKWSPSAPAKYFAFRDKTDGVDPDGEEKFGRLVQIHAASVFGNHPIPRREIEDLPDGLWFSDILLYLLRRWLPNYELDVEPSSYVLADAKWLEPTTLSEIIEEGIAYERGREWAVWGKEFVYKRRKNMGRLWVMRRSEGARFIEAGEASEPDYNGVIVAYGDGDGTPRFAGPPGSGADTEDISLRDRGTDNPVNASTAMGDRFLLVEGGDVGPNKAIELGQIALGDVTRTRFYGEVEAGRYAMCEGEMLPTALIRADDWVLDGDVQFANPWPLSSANYSPGEDRPFQGSIDLPPNRLDAAQTRLEAKPSKVHRRKIREDLTKLRQKARKAENKAAKEAKKKAAEKKKGKGK